jgi:hypothetical protein
LVGGTDTAKLRLLLALHKRLYHKPEEELRDLLHRAGLPLRVLAMVGDAVATCVECRRWARIGTKPSAKGRLASRFNDLVYADLILFDSPPLIYMIMVDDALRFTTIAHVDYKSYESLETAVRRSWISLSGQPRRLRSDKESSLAGDAFGLFLEKQGTQRELVNVGADGQGLMGVLDRRVQLFRTMAPKLADVLAADAITIQPEDLASEVQYAMNTQLSYGGITPYACLFGRLPRAIFNDEEDGCASMELEEGLPFLEHQQIRLRSIAAFQEALLRHRLERAVHSRPRTDQQANYRVGMLIDVFR